MFSAEVSLLYGTDQEQRYILRFFNYYQENCVDKLEIAL